MSNSKYQLGDLVQFNIVETSTIFGEFGEERFVAWVDILNGTITEPDVISVVDKNGLITTHQYLINQKGYISSELIKLNKILKDTTLTLENIFEETDLITIKDFKKIKRVSHFELQWINKRYNCVSQPPAINMQRSLLMKWDGNGSYTSYKLCDYIDGKWLLHSNHSIEVPVDEYCYWDVELKRFYCNGKIFVESNIYV